MFAVLVSSPAYGRRSALCSNSQLLFGSRPRWKSRSAKRLTACVFGSRPRRKAGRNDKRRTACVQGHPDDHLANAFADHQSHSLEHDPIGRNCQRSGHLRLHPTGRHRAGRWDANAFRSFYSHRHRCLQQRQRLGLNYRQPGNPNRRFARRIRLRSQQSQQQQRPDLCFQRGR